MASKSLKQRLEEVTTGSVLDHIKTVVFVYVVLTRLVKVERHLRARGIATTFLEFWTWLNKNLLLFALRCLPAQRKKAEADIAKAKLTIESKLVPQGEAVTRHTSLPAKGHYPEWILNEMGKMDNEIGHAEWKHGKISGAVYHGGDDLTKVIVAAFERYCVSNPLHPDVFPAVRKMEAEIVAMCLRMYNNPTGAGVTTSGGTESIIMSVKTHRDWARATKGITEPEMIVPDTAHAAFDKAAAYFNIKVHTMPVDRATRKVDLNRVSWAINPNTIMLVGSAINFPDGCQDDIVALGKLAQKHHIGMHVDCCLGSFIMPFLEPAGFPVEPFDFRVDGVTAISCDTHKYGFAPKGSSVIMYRNAELRQYQYYVNPSWTGGLYASPSIAGSRPGSIIAGTWAAMQYVGYDGYLKSCREIVGAAKTIAARIKSEFGGKLYVLGNPPASVVAFSSYNPRCSIHEVGDIISHKGWHLNGIVRPDAIHIAVTRLTVPVVDTFIADLHDAVKEAELNPSGKGTMVQLYGLGKVAGALAPSISSQIATAFIDTLYKA
ncbi:PLP-dependent transferase [Phanerochaete sordida]|uniref:sphinganine-1-phosphate aldolase n=1 Tax=Phanerochaete sordida TaxID=48140 RepID=A0A9P3GDF5_9APHY|nr:PLP-dependent transferase [Phanerochaete sordida]